MGTGIATPLLRWLTNHSYPHKPWAREILQILDCVHEPEATIVDAPCGSGVISYWLQRWRPTWNLELLDLSEEAVHLARQRIPRLKNAIRCADVRHIPLRSRSNRDVWIIVNSLFLLDDVQGLIRSNRGRFRQVVVFCDDLERSNYRAIYRDRPWLDGVCQRGVLDQPCVRGLIDRCGYEPVETRGCTFLPSYALGENPASLMALGGLDAFARLCSLPANYWIGVFRRRDDVPELA